MRNGFSMTKFKYKMKIFTVKFMYFSTKISTHKWMCRF